ncbi:MAG: protein kinase [Pirellulales bacterium]|nr:protein kinase [Pirellulales bacterium]
MHPSRDELAGYALGTLDGPRAESVAEHLENCRDCEATIGRLESASDTMLSKLRLGPPDDPYAREEGCRRLVVEAARLKTGRSEAPSAEATDVDKYRPQHLGEYQLLEKLGQGGMGVVYKARHTRLKRIVALKILPKEKTEDSRAVTRFEREMEAIGRLDHPHIVRAYDARDIEGTTVLVMEHVDGLNISRIARRAGLLRVADACEIIRQAALGLQYAHEHGLVHRDIKPSNLMLARGPAPFAPGPALRPDSAPVARTSGQVGVVKILDLGLALLNTGEPDLAGKGELTSAGVAMGTADYMAPEQAGDSHRVDIRADIYSLGCTLYKLLTGQAPFSGPAYKTALDKLMGHVRDQARPVQLVRTDVSDALAAVIERMLAKDPAARFATPIAAAEAVAPFAAGSDLLALLDGNPVPSEPQEAIGDAGESAASAMVGTQPDPPVPAIRPQIAVRAGQSRPSRAPRPLPRSRRRWPVHLGVMAAAAGAVFLLAVVLIIRDQWGREKARYELQPGDTLGIQEEAPAGETQKQAVQPSAAVAVPRPGERSSAVAPAKPVPIQITPEPSDSPAGAPMSEMALVAQPAAIPGVRSWTVETIGHRHAVRAAAYRPDGQVLATAGDDGAVRLWAPDTGKLLQLLAGHDRPVNGLAWSPDGTCLASASDDQTIRFWDVRSGRLLRSVRSEGGAIATVAWSRDGMALASGDGEGNILLLDPASGKALRTWKGHNGAVLSLAWLPDGTMLASAGIDKTWKSWDAKSGEIQHTLAMAEAVWPMALSPDGKTLAALFVEGEAGKVRLLDAATGQLNRELVAPTLQFRSGKVHMLAWSSDGTTVVGLANLESNSVTLYGWSAETGKLTFTEEKYRSCVMVRALAYRADGKQFVMGSEEGFVELCDASSAKRLMQTPTPVLRLTCMAVSRDGKNFFDGQWSSQESTVQFRALDSGALINELSVSQCLAMPPTAIAESSDGKVAVQAGELRICDLREARPLATVAFYWWESALTWTPDAKGVVMRNQVIDAATGNVMGSLPGWMAAWSPDGKRVAFPANEKTVRVFQTDTYTHETWLVGDQPCVGPLAWSHDGKRLAAGCADKGLLVWDVDSGKVLASLVPPEENRVSLRWQNELVWNATGAFPCLAPEKDNLICLSWSDDDQTLLAGSSGATWVWDVKWRKLLRTIRDEGTAFSRDGRIVASRGPGIIRLRQTESGQLMRTILCMRDKQYAAISPDGHFRGSPDVEKELVYVVQTDQGQETLSPEEFSKKYGWKNDPGKLEAAVTDQ